MTTRMADFTYIESLTLEVMTEIIKKERPDGLLPNLGAKRLNLVSELSKAGVLEKYGVKVIGVNVDASNAAKIESNSKTQ